MALDTASCTAKIARAQKHAETFERQVRAWIKERPYTLVAHTNTEGTRHSTFLRVKKPHDGMRWSLLAGDAFHNLRSALDHLVYAIAAHQLSAAELAEVSKKLAFPICNTPNDFNSKRHRIASLSVDVRAEIEAMQPYHRPHPELPPPLSVLRDLDDIDKHRSLHVVLNQSIKGHFKNINWTAPPGTGPVIAQVYTGELKDGAEVAALVTPIPAPDMHYHYLGEVALGLAHEPGPNDVKWSGVIFLFDALRSEVEEVITRVSAKVT